MHAHSRRSCRKSWHQPLRLLSAPAAARQPAGNAADKCRTFSISEEEPFFIMAGVGFSLYLLPSGKTQRATQAL